VWTSSCVTGPTVYVLRHDHLTEHFWHRQQLSYEVYACWLAVAEFFLYHGFIIPLIAAVHGSNITTKFIECSTFKNSSEKPGSDTHLQLANQTLVHFLVLFAFLAQFASQCPMNEDCQHVNHDGKQLTKYHTYQWQCTASNWSATSIKVYMVQWYYTKDTP